jgi:DNA-binding beta-propeller fold protein YncE
VFVDVEDKDNVAVIDANSLQVTGHYGLAGLGGEPAGLALDADHHVLFVFCCNSNTVVILDARDGHVLSSLPIGKGVDAAEFNPATGEAFSSQGDGTLTIIKEDGPTAFHVEQTLATKTGARTSTLDRQTGHLFLATADRVATPPSTPGSRHDRPQLVPGSFTLLEVGR